jgi:hypothetical protein
MVSQEVNQILSGPLIYIKGYQIADVNLFSHLIHFNTGAHPDFHDQLEDLAEARNVAIANARLYRDYQFECAQGAYELETAMAEEEYLVRPLLIDMIRFAWTLSSGCIGN